MGLSVINTHSYLYNPLKVENDELKVSLEVLSGLQKKPKTISPKFFYDQQGSQLFSQICQLVEYYPSSTEMKIMRENIGEITRLVEPDSLLIEYGSGSSSKTRLLLDHLPTLAAYIPVDISKDYLLIAAESLRCCYPNLVVSPLWADFTKPFFLPEIQKWFTKKLAYFPGSTIGNFYPQQAVDFLRHVAVVVGTGGGLLVGVDLQKDPAILNQAYNDAKGVTAAFNLNMLAHINRRFQANFDMNQFEHSAFYNQEDGRIEMHLISKRGQRVSINGSLIDLDQGESILTEVSYKYTLESFARIAHKAGFNVQKVWLDSRKYFSVQYLVAK